MPYMEEKDLIENVKNLRLEVDRMCKAFGEVEPSMNEILKLKGEFNDLANTTVAVIKMYETSLSQKNDEYKDLLENCKSQFKQVTNDVESLVSLEVNFTDIQTKIEQCLRLSEHLTNLVQGPVVLMKNGASYVQIKDRLPYKRYYNVTDVLATSGSGTGAPPTQYVVGPNMGISFDAP